MGFPSNWARTHSADLCKNEKCSVKKIHFLELLLFSCHEKSHRNLKKKISMTTGPNIYGPNLKKTDHFDTQPIGLPFQWKPARDFFLHGGDFAQNSIDHGHLAKFTNLQPFTYLIYVLPPSPSVWTEKIYTHILPRSFLMGKSINWFLATPKNG